jgi:hypothetical protein
MKYAEADHHFHSFISRGDINVAGMYEIKERNGLDWMKLSAIGMALVKLRPCKPLD